MLLSEYTEELEILKDLFVSDLNEDKLKNITAIYNASEFYWDKNLDYIIDKGINIKYLLIGEAPPYYEITNMDEVKYFYNPDNTTVPQSYLEKVFNALYPDQKEDRQQYTSDSKKEKLNLIAKKGFLLVDSLPFAMDFSENKKTRDKVAYKKLVKKCATSYLSDKLNNPNIPWHDKGVKIAFSVLRNARQVIDNWPQDLKFTHCVLKENTKPPFLQVAVNGYWQLCEKKLRRIFCVKNNLTTKEVFSSLQTDYTPNT